METVAKILGYLALIAVIVILLAVPVYLLWNWLMPDLFNLPRITLMQALGLTTLCHLLFKATPKTEK